MHLLGYGTIQCLLVINQVFDLPLRAMSGLAGSLVQWLDGTGPRGAELQPGASEATVA